MRYKELYISFGDCQTTYKDPQHKAMDIMQCVNYPLRVILDNGEQHVGKKTLEQKKTEAIQIVNNLRSVHHYRVEKVFWIFYRIVSLDNYYKQLNKIIHGL